MFYSDDDNVYEEEYVKMAEMENKVLYGCSFTLTTACTEEPV